MVEEILLKEKMKREPTFVPGWYFMQSSATYHYFETEEKPICGAKKRGTTEFLKPIRETRSHIIREAMTRFQGGCKGCINRIKRGIS